jgi:hypothetical protein
MMATRTSERSGRLIDSDEAASMEKEEARGVFLMITYAPNHVTVSSGGSDGPRQRACCVSDLRLGGRRQVDAHRPAAV